MHSEIYQNFDAQVTVQFGNTIFIDSLRTILEVKKEDSGLLTLRIKLL